MRQISPMPRSRDCSVGNVTRPRLDDLGSRFESPEVQTDTRVHSGSGASFLWAKIFWRRSDRSSLSSVEV
jgi:hypothetical protein